MAGEGKRLRLDIRARMAAVKPVSTRYVDVLDGIRALCVFGVAWFHIWQQSWLWPGIHTQQLGTLVNLEPLVRAGYILVDTMLLISGFLLFLPYARHMTEGEPLPSARDFYVKRALRILPSYWLCLLIVLLGFALPRREFTDTADMLRDLLSHLSFTHVFWYETYIATHLNVVLWTLAIEVQFYLIFPLLARLFVRRPLVTWGGMAAAGLAFRYLVVLAQPDTNMWVNQLPAFLDVYANGMLAALCYVHLARALRADKWTRLLFTALALLAVVGLWQIIVRQAASNGYETIRINQARNRFWFSAFGCALIVCAANAGAGLRWLLSNRVMRVASAVSFQYYMWHQFLAVQLKRWGFPPSVSPEPHIDGEMPWQWQYTLCAFLLPLVLSLVLTYCFEQPIARAGLRWWKARQQRGRLPDGETQTSASP